jgi:mannosyltransferase
VWLIRLGELADPLAELGAAKEKALRENYRSEQVWRPGGLTVALFVRAPRGR